MPKLTDWTYLPSLAPSLHPDADAWRRMDTILTSLAELADRAGGLTEPLEQLLTEARLLASDAVLTRSQPSLTHGFCGETDPAATAARHAADLAAIAERHPNWVVAPEKRTVVAFLRQEPWDGSPDMTATVCVDADGYTIPEVEVASDGIHDRGAPQFDRYADAIRWARVRGFRVWTESDTSRDLPGRDVTPSPRA